VSVEHCLEGLDRFGNRLEDEGVPPCDSDAARRLAALGLVPAASRFEAGDTVTRLLERLLDARSSG